MVNPGDERAAGAESQARLRASAADREQVIEVLKVGFVQDRITKDELDQRIGQALASQTCDDLDILTADIPGALIGARPAEPARPDVSKKKLVRRTSAAVASTSFVIAEAVALSHQLNPLAGVIAGLVAGAFTAGLLAVLLTLIAWAIDRSAGRQPSQRPPPGALENAAQHPAPADPARHPRQSSRRPRPGAEAARSGLPHSPLAGLRSPQRSRSLTTLALCIARSPAGRECSRDSVRGARAARKPEPPAQTHTSGSTRAGPGPASPADDIYIAAQLTSPATPGTPQHRAQGLNAYGPGPHHTTGECPRTRCRRYSAGTHTSGHHRQVFSVPGSRRASHRSETTPWRIRLGISGR